MKLQMLDCPVCHAHTLEPFTRTETGENFWYCKDCGALYADQNDAPAQKLSELCPACGKQITLNEGVPGTGKHWKCRTCKLCLADSDGKPVPAQECPSCGKMSFSRFEAHDKPGVFFWGCTLCKHHSEDQ